MRLARRRAVLAAVVLGGIAASPGCGGENVPGDGGGIADGGGVGDVDSGGSSDGGADADGGDDFDGSLPGEDAGRPIDSDAATRDDAGSTDPDAGSMGMDGAIPPTDAGTDAGFDAGTDAGFDAGPPAMCVTDADCAPLVACTATRLITQTYSCARGFCLEDAPIAEDCAARDSDTCSGDAVVSTRGTCDAASLACVTSTTTTPCASPMCDASGDYVTESCGGGVCRATSTGCAPGVSTTCSGATYRVTTRGCDAASGCTASTVSSSCSAGRPECTGSGATLTHVTYTAACNPGGTDCLVDGAPTNTRCVAPADRCASATLTRFTPTCDPSAGCDSTSSSRPCPVARPTCVGLEHTTYTAACADATSCSATGTPTTVTCPQTADTCVGDRFVDYTATCSATSGCAETNLATDCAPAAPRLTCLSRSAFSWTSGQCTSRGCVTGSGMVSCLTGGSVCMNATEGMNCGARGTCSDTTGACSTCTAVRCARGTTCAIDPRSGLAGCR